ncbi:amidase signature domain-containing protein [Stachybotrys elegans]|uniref:Amidase signature domain-containing protein n=1 Tax=Stachybotrys elegans TaxID=80388 RepID=A0A8K0SUL1_9HYPO|nr:amidase signature domain-containing protein [Stachybotrys elegans]
MAAQHTPLYTLTGSQALALLKQNAVTVEGYASALLERIKDRDPTVRAWTYLDPAYVLRQARELDQIPQDQRGPLHGLPVGVKDVINTQDMPTQFGSALYQGHQPSLDSSAVAILRAAGALIFGKTTTTEFTVANSGPGTTNPHDPNRTPGGSSCGSAAAVADFHVPVSLGTQTGGSIIRPASYTGIFALKPTFNAVSPEGQKMFSPTFDTFGFFARSVQDLQLLSDVLAIQDDEAPKGTPLEDMFIALMKTPMWPSAGQGTIAAMDKAVMALRESGIQVQEVDFPPDMANAATLKRIQKIICMSEAQESFLREYRMDKSKLGPEMRALLEDFKSTHKERVDATDTYNDMRRIMNGLSLQYSAIIAPSAADEAPVGLDDMGSAIFNTMWTGFHMPVVNVPAFTGDHGMPIGLSLVASRFRDQHLLRVAMALVEPLVNKGGWRAEEGSRQQ